MEQQQQTTKPGKVLRFKKRYEDRVFQFDQNTRSRQVTLSKLKQDIGCTEGKPLKDISSIVKDYNYNDIEPIVENKHFFTSLKDWHSFLQLQQKWMTQNVLHFNVIQREMNTKKINKSGEDIKEEEDVFAYNIKFPSAKNSEEYSFANEKLFVHQLRLWIETYGVPSIAITNEVLGLKKDLVRVNEEANALEDECVQLYLKVYQLEEKLENNHQCINIHIFSLCFFIVYLFIATENLQRDYLLLKKQNIAITADIQMQQYKNKTETRFYNPNIVDNEGDSVSHSQTSNRMQSPPQRKTAGIEGHHRRIHHRQNKQYRSSTVSGVSSSKLVSSTNHSWQQTFLESDNSDFDVIANVVPLSNSNSNTTGKQTSQVALYFVYCVCMLVLHVLFVCLYVYIACVVCVRVGK